MPGGQKGAKAPKVPTGGRGTLGSRLSHRLETAKRKPICLPETG